MEKKQSVMGRFVSYFKPHWKLFTLDMACAVLIAVVDIIFPIVSREALNRWLPQQEYRVFFLVMAILALAFVLRAGYTISSVIGVTPSVSVWKPTFAATSITICRRWALISTIRTAQVSL